MLALDARAAVSLSADDALQVEPLHVDFAHPYWSFRRHVGSWDPHGAREVNPFVEGLGRGGPGALQPLLVPLQEKGVVFGNLGDRLALEEVEIDEVLREVFPSFFLRHDKRLLEVALAT